VDYLRNYYDCQGKTWTADSGLDISFPAGFGKRRPDVIAISSGSDGTCAHIVEAKLLKIPTHGFDETINQLDSLKGYADFLWAAFPKDRWNNAEDNHARWRSELKRKGYGLFLVSGTRVKVERDAPKNDAVTPEHRSRLIDALTRDLQKPIHIDSLSSAAARSARAAVSRVAEIMDGPVKQVFGKRIKKNFARLKYWRASEDYILLGEVDTVDVWIEGDPLGFWLQDGQPVVWFWKGLGDLDKTDTKTIENESEDAFFYADNGKDNDQWKWTVAHQSEFNADHLQMKGHVHGIAMGRRVIINDRTDNGIRTELKRLLKWSRL
jgi:hypothetical protein